MRILRREPGGRSPPRDEREAAGLRRVTNAKAAVFAAKPLRIRHAALYK
jgi:hypothetical protein